MLTFIVLESEEDIQLLWHSGVCASRGDPAGEGVGAREQEQGSRCKEQEHWSRSRGAGAGEQEQGSRRITPPPDRPWPLC